jgi:hypothetical protein
MKRGSEVDVSGHDGRPATYHHPLRDVLGATGGGPDGPDHLLDRLRQVHGEPRYDCPRIGAPMNVPPRRSRERPDAA